MDVRFAWPDSEEPDQRVKRFRQNVEPPWAAIMAVAISTFASKGQWKFPAEILGLEKEVHCVRVGTMSNKIVPCRERLYMS